MTRSTARWVVRLLARTIASPHRDAMVGDLLDDYDEARRAGRGLRAETQLARDLIRSAFDSHRQAWLERQQHRAGRRGALMTTLGSDLKSAWRQHAGHPAGTAWRS